MSEAFQVPERISLELLRRCGKQCHFCYNASHPTAPERWRADEVITLMTSLVEHGSRALSLGGGEPLEYDELEPIFEALKPLCFVSMTTNGLLLDAQLDRIERLRPDKVHISVHYPSRAREVERVIRQVGLLRWMGIRAGVNLLVRASELEESARAAAQMREAGIEHDAIMFLPMRGDGARDSPTPAQVSAVAGGAPFQSMSCLMGCAKSPRFCSIDASKRVAHCSYTSTRRALKTLDARGLHEALDGLGLSFCGD